MSPASLLILALLVAAAPLYPELRRPPERVLPPVTPPISPFPTRQSEWPAARVRLLERVTSVIGSFPERVPPKVEDELREDQPDHTRLLVRYRLDPEYYGRG